MSNDEPTDGRCNAKTRDGGYCANYPKGDADRCRMHGADSNGDGAPEGNDWAAKHGAWSESFMSDFLTEKEQARVQDAVDTLGSPAGAQEQAKVAASICLEQFRRTGDERFMRRYESICETFGVTPDDDSDGDSVDVNVEISTLDADEKAQLDAVLDRDVQE